MQPWRMSSPATPNRLFFLHTLTVLLAVACLLSPAAADGFSKLAATAGKAAAQSLATAAAAESAFRITAFEGPSATLDQVQSATNVTFTPSDGSDGEHTARERLKLAQELKKYLETVFADKPDALARIKGAWEQEQKDAFKSSRSQLPNDIKHHKTTTYLQHSTPILYLADLYQHKKGSCTASVERSKIKLE